MAIKKQQAGFVLLMSSLVISAVLVAVIFSLSFGGFFTRFNILDSANKEASLGLAEGCGNIAVLKRIQDNSYVGDETVAVGSGTCRILPFDVSGTGIIIKTTAVKDRAVSNVIIELNSSTFNIQRRREVAQF